MLSFLKNFEPQIYAAFRIVMGFSFLFHGTQKLFGFPKPPPDMPAAMLYAAGGIEFAGGALLMIGLMTRPVAFLCSGTMAVAYWMVHGLNHALPMMNGGELAVVYCFVFLLIAAKGSGIWSVDGDK
jgi:putative oxidoreductase